MIRNILLQNPDVRIDSLNKFLSSSDIMKATNIVPEYEKSDFEQEKYLVMSEADMIAQHLIDKIRKFWE
jgi:hypothetical protein